MKENIVVFFVILLFVEIIVGILHIAFYIFNIEFYPCIYWIMVLAVLVSCILGFSLEKVIDCIDRKFHDYKL